jgi:hypothetical protein
MVYSTNSADRRSGRPGAGTHRKRAATLAEETRQSCEALNKAKKPRRRAPTITIRSSPPRQESPLFKEEELDEELDEQLDEELDEQLDEELEEKLEEPQELEYSSSWVAIVNRRLELSGGQTGKWLQSYLSKDLLDSWQTESYIAYQGDLNLSYQYTEAVITHEKCRAQDQSKCDIKDGENLNSVYELLQEIQNNGFQPVL